MIVSNSWNFSHRIMMNARAWIWTIGWWIRKVAFAFNHRAMCIATVDGGWVFIPLSAHHPSSFQFLSTESSLNLLVFFLQTIFQIFHKTSSSHSSPLILSRNLSKRKNPSACLVFVSLSHYGGGFIFVVCGYNASPKHFVLVVMDNSHCEWSFPLNSSPFGPPWVLGGGRA